MRILKICNKIVYQGRCAKCGALLELDEEEFAETFFDCPVCEKWTMLKRGTITRFFVDEGGKYSRG